MARILVAEDYPVTQRLLGFQLARGGHEARVAGDGAAALALLDEAARAGEPFELAIVDVAMPGMDGLELLERLRADPRFRTLPTLVLTASGQDEDRERASAAGATAFLDKPASSVELLEAVDAALRDAAALAEDGGTLS